jgi:hypothetical protein
MGDLYKDVEDLLEALHSHRADPQEMQNDSHCLKEKLIAMVETLTHDGPLAPRELTLAALAGGMFAGALDGTTLFLCGQRVEQPALNGLLPHLARPTQLLWENLARILETAQSNWSCAHVDDLQLLSGYGKHENRLSLEEGEQMEAKSRDDLPKFQAFLLAGFKGGYAMGVVDAAVMFVGGERPGAAPQSAAETAPGNGGTPRETT